MKKILSFLAVLTLGLVLVACGTKTYEIAMITDTGDIDDGSFNQGTWEGIVEYAEEHDKTHQYYKPAGESNEAYLAAIDLAVSGGAKIVITPGFYFEVPIFDAQTKYPDVKFVILDGSPHKGDYNAVVKDNTLSVFFQEEQSGFLAGYAAVKDGFTKLGYMGGVPVPAVQRFGIGWVAGAYLAAKEEEVANFNFAAANYTYVGGFAPTDAIKTQAASWFTGGVEVIHAAAGGAGSSVMAAAGEASTAKWVVGVDSDQATHSNTVLSSAVKGVGQAAYDALELFYTDKFPGGKVWNLGAKENGIGLPMETSRFTKFDQTAYDAIFAKLVAGTVVVPANVTDLVAFVEALDVDGYVITVALQNNIVPPAES